MALAAANLFLAGLAPVAYTLVGAIGIGLAAFAFRQRPVRHYYHHGHSHGHSHHHHGSSYSGHRHHRKKRSFEVEGKIERLLEVVRAEDTTGCGLRLVCELGAKPERLLSENELAILALIGPPVKPGEGLLRRSARAEYQQARGLGELGFKCGRHFFNCPLDGTQLMASINNLLP